MTTERFAMSSVSEESLRESDANALLNRLRGRQALVTGGLGFIGSNTARSLVDFGCKVVVIDSLEDGQGGNRFNLLDVEDRIEIRIADIRDEAAIGDAVKGSDFIFHIAGTGSHLDSLNNPYRDLELNVRGTLSVLEATRKNAADAHVVFAGTRSEYGQIQSSPVSEDHPLLPSESNSVHKAAATLYQLAYNTAFGLKTTSIRLPNVYGPRMLISHYRIGFINWFVKLAIQGETISLYGDGNQKRDMLYVDDVVRSLLMAATAEESVGEILNIGSGQPSSLSEIAEMLIDISGAGKVVYVPFPEEAKRIEIGDYIADIRKISGLLPWRPSTSLRQGLEHTVHYYQKSKEHYL